MWSSGHATGSPDSGKVVALLPSCKSLKTRDAPGAQLAAPAWVIAENYLEMDTLMLT